MKKIIPTLMLLPLLFCIVFSSQAQTHNNYYAVFNSEKASGIENMKLPANRAAFLFLNKSSSYTNPAIAVLNNRNNVMDKKSTEENTAISVSSYVENKINTENIRMFPNLTQDELWVKVDTEINTEEMVNVEIYNDNGDRIYHSRLNENLHKINLCNFTAGTFLVKLGENVKKLVIE